MKKLLLMLCMMLATSLVANAQFFTAGIKAGASSSSVDIKDPVGTLEQFKESDNITGYHAGGFVRLNIMNVLLQPELVLSTTGGKVEVTDSQTSTNVHIDKFRFNRMDVPVLLGLNFFKVARVHAGPVASVLINGKVEKEKINEYLDNADWGWQVGAGVDISNITLDVRYERIKRGYANSAQNSSFDIVNQQVLVSLGFKLIGRQ